MLLSFRVQTHYMTHSVADIDAISLQLQGPIGAECRSTTPIDIKAMLGEKRDPLRPTYTFVAAYLSSQS